MKYVLIARMIDNMGNVKQDSISITEANSPEAAAENLHMSQFYRGAVVQVYEMSDEPVATFDVEKAVKVKTEIRMRR